MTGFKWACTLGLSLLLGGPGCVAGGIETTGSGSEDASGDGDGDGDGDVPGDPGAPGASISFPPDGGTTAERITVRGAARADGPIAAVRVAGVEAESSDGFATWRADVALEPGSNTLAVTVELASGERLDASDTAVIERWSDEGTGARGLGDWPGRMLGVAFDSEAERAVVSDDVVDGVFAIAVASGDRTVLSDSESTVEVGSGYELVRPTNLAVYAGTALVLDGEAVVSIDLASGDRTAISEPGGAGSGVAIASLRDIAADPATGRTLLLVGEADGSGPALVEIDPVTGARTLVATSGASLDNGFRFAVDWARRRALVLRQYSNELTLIDLDSGARTTLPDDGAVRLANPEHIAISDESALVWSDGALVRVDLDSGARTVLGGDGLALRGVAALTGWSRGALAVEYVPDWEEAPRSPMLIAVDPVEGTRVVLAR